MCSQIIIGPSYGFVVSPALMLTGFGWYAISSNSAASGTIDTLAFCSSVIFAACTAILPLDMAIMIVAAAPLVLIAG